MSRFIWIFGVLLLAGSVGGVGWLYSQNVGQKNHAGPSSDSLPPHVVCLGFIDAQPGVAKLYPVQSGRVVEVVAEGMHVEKGQVLLKLDDRLARNRCQEAEADLNASVKLLEQARTLVEKHAREIEGQQAVIDAAIAERELILAKQGAEKEARSPDSKFGQWVVKGYAEAVKKAEAAIKGEQTKLEALRLADPNTDIRRAEADVQAKQARLEQAKLGVEECSLRAPSAGTVVRVHAHVGEVLGSNPTSPALEFAPAGALVVRAEVMQEWARSVQVGQTVTIEDDTHHEPGESWQGKVKEKAKWFGPKRRIIIEPFMVNDVRTLECLIEVTSEGPRPLLIGQRVRVTIDTAKK